MVIHEPATVVGAPQPSPRHRSWRAWTAIAVAVAVVGAGAVAGTLLVRRYRYTPVLHAYGFGWVGPDVTRAHESSADGYSQSTVPATGSRQAFLVLVNNDSSVTQTILGLAPPSGPTVAAPRLTGAVLPHGESSDDVRYTAGPLTVQPHQTAALRFNFRRLHRTRRATHLGPAATSGARRVLHADGHRRLRPRGHGRARYRGVAGVPVRAVAGDLVAPVTG